MCVLELKFSGVNSPQLDSSSFAYSSFSEPMQSVRGKTSGALSASGTFQWTAGVQALVVLVLRTAGGMDFTKAALVGENSSLASSLDYALSKQTNWLAEMFGWDSQGNLVARRLFKRTNPERKRSGPVIVALNKNLFSEDSIRIYLDEYLLTDAQALLDLSAAIESQWSSRNYIRLRSWCKLNGGCAKESNKGIGDARTVLSRLITQEINTVLLKTDIFNRCALQKNIQKLQKNPSVSKLASNAQFLSPMDTELLSSYRLGLADESFLKKHLSSDQPLRIALPAPGPAAALIFQYLISIKKYNLILDFRFPHAIEIGQRIIQHSFELPPDACVLGIAPAAQVLGHHKRLPYQPLMMMPKNTQRIISGKSSKRSKVKLNAGDYYMLRDDPSNPQFYFDELERDGEISSSQIKLHHMESDEVFSMLRTGDDSCRAILFFPHYLTNSIYNGANLIDAPNDSRQNKEMFLFVHDSIFRNREKALSLDIAIRDAWLTLRDDSVLRGRIIKHMTNNNDYLKFMYRACGLHNLNMPVL